ncbi:hypothetical protein MLP_34350 [Microlunatus phosphovorus NM-1]|uniref:Spore coat protein CotH n=2 Tax=Microlunatus phosphovorus TaxID=29405 RepID=F5XMJ2_MICPN|nr:hypothetical protein MLP_34350 [Microlunatus phosphovorus NM-1]
MALRHHRSMPRLRTGIAAATLSLALFLSGCSLADIAATSNSVTAGVTDNVLDESKLHTISVEVDEATLREMIQTYLDQGDKEWIKATVTIDGETFDDVGIKLKGNSSLRNITVDTPAQELPLRIRLDKYVDGQNADGYSDFTVRSNSSETAINEAVALDLLSDAGLASEEAISTRFSVNGSDEKLRLTVQNLDDTWVEQNFPEAGADSVLYKSEADGDWSWRGEDGDYTSSFEVEAGEETYAPLIELLDLVNNGTAAEIAKKLPTLLDVDSFASYLAFEDLIDNFDDIDGPGNNSYLLWDSATKKFTVVAWDHNLAFGSSPGGGGGRADGGRGGGMPAGQRPSGMPEGRGSKTKENPLSTAFLANAEWKTLYQQATTDLQAKLIDNGTLTETVGDWSQLLTTGASDLVATDTLTTEADKIRSYAA